MPVSLALRVLRVAELVALGCLAVGVVVATAYFVPTRPELALGLAALVCLFGLTLADSAIVPLLMVVPALATYRVAAGGIDLALSDAALAFAFFPALLFAQRPYTPALRSMLWLGAAYQAATFFTLVANPYRANYVEWVHAGLLIGGALVVGWSIGREGHARLALTVMLVAMCALGISVIVQGLTQYAQGNFSGVYPQWPYLMHKNAAGCLLGFGAAVAYARPSWLRWHPLFAYSAFWICVTGLGITQSRQAMAGLAAALIVIVMRTHGKGKERRSKVILLAVLAALGFVLVMVRNQIASGNEHNSFFQRVDWFNESLRIWQTDPLFGVGLRWWYTDRFEVAFQPPNAILETASAAGVVGLAGFLVLMAGSLTVLWARMDLRYGLPALTIVLSRFVQGQLDLFWVAVQTSVPFLIAGICLGAHGREMDELPPVEVVDQQQPADRPLESSVA